MNVNEQNPIRMQVQETTGSFEESSIGESILDGFLKLDAQGQKEKIQNENFLIELKDIIKKADQKKIRSNEKGDTLFHQILRSPLKETRELASLCLEAGAEINAQNKLGATGLHFVALNGDEALLESFLEKGAHQIETHTKITPIAFALSQKHHASALLLASKNSKLTPENFIAQFIGKVDVQHILEFLEEFSKKNNLNLHAEAIWKFCEGIFDFMGYENSDSDYEAITLWLLDHHVKSEANFDDQSKVIRWVAKKMTDRSLSGKNDKVFLEKMINNGLLPTIILNSNEWFLFKIADKLKEKKITLDYSLENQINELSQVKPYSDLYELSRKFLKEEDWDSLSNILKELEGKLQDLKEEKFPNSELFEKILKNQLNSKISKVENYRKNLINIEKEKELGDCSSDIFYYLMKKAVKEDQWNWIPKLQIAKKNYQAVHKGFQVSQVGKYQYFENDSYKYRNPSKLTYLLMMDKLNLPIEKRYEGSTLDYTAPALLSALHRLKSIPLEEIKIHELKENILSISENLKPIMEEFIDLCELRSDNHQLVNRIIENIQNLKENSSLLIPLGIKIHATCLLVTKTAGNTFKITHYNTGGGVEKHYRWQQSLQFQTFDTILGIPQDTILNPNSWELLCDMSSIGDTYEDIDLLYKCILNNIGKGGTKAPASEHEEDYEAIQDTGACGMQALMAFLRHQTMQLAKGSPSEKEAFYKIFKAQMFIQFNKDNIGKLDKSIQEHLPTILNKLNAESEFAKIAANEKTFDEALQTITGLLEKSGEKEQAESIKKREASTTLSRYAILRQASIKLSIAWLKNPKNPPPENVEEQKDLELASAKFKHYSATISNVEGQLKEHLQTKDVEAFDSLLYTMFLKPQFHEFAIDRMTQLCGENIQFTEKLLDKFNSNREKRNPLVKEVVSRLEKNGEGALAAQMTKYWQVRI